MTTPSLWPVQVVEQRTARRVAGSDRWTTFVTYSVAPPSTEPWSMAVEIWAGADPGVTGSIRLRTNTGVQTPAAIVTGQLDGALLGFTLFSTPAAPVAQTLLFLEGRRDSGSTGGVYLRTESRPVIMSAPPPSQLDGPHYPAGYTPPADLWPPTFLPVY